MGRIRIPGSTLMILKGDRSQRCLGIQLEGLADGKIIRYRSINDSILKPQLTVPVRLAQECIHLRKSRVLLNGDRLSSCAD
jgi:hypothetical protein